jgi:hypothetical protein
MSTINTTQTLPALRVSLECGMPTLAAFNGHDWVQLPVLSILQAIKFAATLGYTLPDDAFSRVKDGAIVTLEQKARS